MSEPLEQRLRRDLAGLDAVPLDDDLTVAAATGRANRRRARRRHGAVIGASVVVVLLGGAGVWAVRDRDRSATTPGPPAVDGPAPASAPPTATPPTATPPTTTPPTTEPTATGPTTIGPQTTASTVEPQSSASSPPVTDEPNASTEWPTIAPDPRGAVVGSAVVWSGNEAIVVGGRDADNTPVDGASAYDPATDTWRQLADPPTGRDVAGRVDPLSVWTGSEMLILGGDLPDGLPAGSVDAYTPATDRWRVLSQASSFIYGDSPWAWTGSELLIWPADGGNPSLVIDVLAYNPATDTWRTLAEPPVERRRQAASVWTGTEWLIWGGADDGVELDDGVAYDPATDTWRTIAASPLTARRVGGVWTGSEMIVAAGYRGGDHGAGISALGDAAAYDPRTDSWRQIAGGVAHPGFQAVWTGSELLMFAKTGAVIYDPATDAWTESCCTSDGRGFGSAPIWTGSTALLIGSTDRRIGGFAFTPRSSGG